MRFWRRCSTVRKRRASACSGMRRRFLWNVRPTVALPGKNCIFKISAVPLSAELEIKPDYDGEERILVLELSVSVDVRVWREEEMELLTDLYSLREKAVPVVRERIGERLLVKNAAKCRVTEQLEIPESQEKILQICACEGTVRLEKYEPVENGIRAEGTITAELLYITTDDNMPIQSAREIYPFSQILEIPGYAAGRGGADGLRIRAAVRGDDGSGTY